MPANTHSPAQIEATFREQYVRILAALTSQVGDFPLAENALQGALVNAMESWCTAMWPWRWPWGHRWD